MLNYFVVGLVKVAVSSSKVDDARPTHARGLRSSEGPS